MRRRAAEQRGPLEATGVRRVVATAAVAGALVTTVEPIGGGIGVGSTPSAQAAERKPLEKGDRGGSVRKLQRALGLDDDGVFGERTERAVKRFQTREDLQVDGIVGPATRAKLPSTPTAADRTRASSTSRSKTRKLTRSNAIKLVQRTVGVDVDGVYGPQTVRAVKRFQRRHRLEVDGVVGPQTWRAIGGGLVGPTLKPRGDASSRSDSGTSGDAPSPDAPAKVQRAIRAANEIADKPYRLGGGHGRFNDSAYDCSGAVSYVLHAIGALDSPLDSSGLMSWGESGKGKHITVYTKPSHAFIEIDGRRFDTSGAGEEGPRWRSGAASKSGYTVRHPAGL